MVIEYVYNKEIEEKLKNELSIINDTIQTEVEKIKKNMSNISGVVPYTITVDSNSKNIELIRQIDRMEVDLRTMKIESEHKDAIIQECCPHFDTRPAWVEDAPHHK